MKPAHLGFAVLIHFCFGVNFIAGKIAVADLPPMMANGLRFSMVLLVLLPWLRIVPGQMRSLLWVAFLLGGVHFAVFYYGIAQGGDISNMVIISQLAIPFSTLLGVFILGETIGVWRTVSLVIAFLGVGVMTFDPAVLAYWQTMFWLGLAALIYSIAAIYMRRLEGVGVLTLMAWQGVIATPLMLVMSVLLEGDLATNFSGISTAAVLAVLFSAVFSSIVGHGGMYYLLQRYPVSDVMPYGLLMPVFGITAGILVMGEDLSFRTVFGGGLILLGVGVITARNIILVRRTESGKA